jgi:hypothetical protein
MDRLAECYGTLLTISLFSVWAFGHEHRAEDWRCLTIRAYFGIPVPEPYQFMENLQHPYSDEAGKS